MSTLFGSIACNAPLTTEVQWIGSEVALVILSFLAGFIWFRTVNPALMRIRRRNIIGPKEDRSIDRTSTSSSSLGEPVRTQVKEATKQSKTDVRPLCMSRLPRELAAEAAMFMDLKDMASLGAANRSAWSKFWQAPEVWSMLAAHHGLDPLRAVDSGAVAREAFRRGAYRVDGRRLNLIGAANPGSTSATLSCAHTAVLAEAAHVVRGLMPSDGAAAAEGLCHAAEKSLQAHDPAKKEAAAAADTFLRMAHRRVDVLTAQQMERLEGAYGSALQLQALMDDAMQHQFEQFEHEPSPQVPLASLSPLLPEFSPGARSRSVSPPGERSMDAALEDVHEAQRHSELDVLLEELRRQNGQ